MSDKVLSREEFVRIIPLAISVTPLSRGETNKILAHDAEQRDRIAELEAERDDWMGQAKSHNACRVCRTPLADGEDCGGNIVIRNT